MIYILIDYHEAVVCLLIGMQDYTGILGVMRSNILTELARNLTIVNINRYTCVAFCQLYEYGIVNVVVDNDDSFMSLADEVGNENVSIEDLTLEENTFLWLN